MPRANVSVSKKLSVQTAAEWRQWLKANHAKVSEVWLTFYKGEVAKDWISHEESVSEALCYGWIDSILRSIDTKTYVRKFTPRKPNSRWSPSNKRRVDLLVKSGKMTPIGLSLAKAAKETGAWDKKTTATMKFSMPAVLKSMLSAHEVANANFQKMSPSNRRLYIMWVASAKKAETQERRAKEAVQRLAKNQKLGLK